jgi:carotenoid cleavage dioxygenase-like enzyme
MLHDALDPIHASDNTLPSLPSSQVHFIPRPGKTPPSSTGPAKAHVISAPPFFSFHHVNAYELNGGERVVLDTISWQDIAFEVSQHSSLEERKVLGGLGTLSILPSINQGPRSCPGD